MNLVKRRRNCLRKTEKMNNGGVCVFKKNVIYCYINKLNGHTYIGQSINFKERLRRHSNGVDADHSAIDRAIQKYGIENFDIEIWENVDYLDGDLLKKGLNAMERLYIALLNPYYNITDGGDFNPMDSEIGRENHKKAMQDPIRRKKCSEFMKKNNPMFREDVKAKLKETHKFLYGVDNPSKREDVKQKISQKKNKTGIYRLRKHYRKGCKQGYNWEYESEDGKRISSVSLEKLLKKMDENDYPLIILDKEKAKITLMGVSADADHFLETYTETRKVYSRQA